MPSEPLRIVIADDHPLFRSGIRALVHAEEGMELVGEATTGNEALTMARTLEPDVILMDLQMPGMGGVEATRRIVAQSAHVQILILTMFEDDRSVVASIRAGARGYVLKGAGPDAVVRAIRAVASGEAIFGPRIAEKLIGHVAQSRTDELVREFPGLTDRERQVLHLLADGASNVQIARSLSLSSKTVANHVSNILGKLGVTDRVQAMLRSREAGFGEDGRG